MNKRLLIIAAVLLMGLLRAESFWYWHEKKPLDKTTRYFRVNFELPDAVTSAPIYIGCDDIGDIYVNGKLIRKQQHWHARQFNLAPQLRQGKNTLAVQIYNAKPPAGLIFGGEILLKNNTIIMFESNNNVLSAEEAPEGWTLTEFDDSKWRPAEKLGNAAMKPWADLTDMSMFFPKAAPPAKPEDVGRMLLDDFADISSWLGGPGEGSRPGSAHPINFNFGSVPDERRDDGYAGALNFDTVKPRGLARFAKNSIYKTPVVPEAIVFSANPEGNSGDIRFSFHDRFGRQFDSADIKISGNEWKEYRVDFNAENIRKFEQIAYPVVLREMHYRNDVPAASRILLDDFYYITDISEPSKQIAINPEYVRLDHPVNTPVPMNFRLRNGRKEPVQLKLELKVYDGDRKLLVTRNSEARLEVFGFGRVQFDLGRFARKGGYCVELTANNGKVSHTYRGWLGVFAPNNGRFNKIPMWFGVEDQEVNTAPFEVALHVEWMKLLGADMIRGGLLGHGAEGQRGGTLGFDGYRKLWSGHVEAGLDICLDYAGGIPGWAKGAEKRPEGALWPSGYNPELFKEHIQHMGEFIKTIPAIKWFEWFNEPNLHRGINIPDYMEGMRLLYPILKEINPELKVGTGGNVVAPHPNAAPGFLEQAYLVNSDYYDIALYHAHDGTQNYKRYTEELMDMLKKKGLKKPVANTETGFRSYQREPVHFYTQAKVLVQKIAYSRAVELEFYVWFMVQDYWDKYINADDSFGLVTVDNQPKPSFVAYNEIIRQLANTTVEENVELDSRLESYKFAGETQDVFVAWAKQDNAVFSFCLKSTAPVELYDIFGNQEILNPVNGIVFVNSKKMPFYLRAKKGAASPVGELLRITGDQVRLPGATDPLDLELKNPYRETINYALKYNQEQLKGTIRPGETKKFRLPVSIDGNAAPGTVSLPVAVELSGAKGQKLYQGEIQLQVFVALGIGKAPARIVLDNESQLTELVFDPTTPRWSGKDDLSADIKVQRSATALVFEAAVRDQEHAVPFRGTQNWRNDSIQVGLANKAGIHTEITVSDSPDGAIAWCHIAPDKKNEGLIKIPLTITRQQDTTLYRFEIPFGLVGITPRAGELFRMALLVNDNDGGRRLRIMEYFKGIEGSKAPGSFGYMKLLD